MKTWHKLSPAHVDYDKDAVVTIYSTRDGVRAAYRLPDELTQLADYQVEELLEIATNSIGALTHETVVLDEDEQWDDRWGNLIDHPTRGTKIIGKPVR